MRTRIILLSLIFFSGILPCPLFSQSSNNPYILNGSASQESCNCYQLTDDIQWQAGSIWNKNKISLTESFNYVFNVYLGCKDNTGADGIAFVLQPLGTSIGSQGEGIGFQNVIPSVGIPIDTWQNIDLNDPYFDHIGIFKNGDLHVGTANTLAAPVPASPVSDNIEDCQWHTLRIIWDADAMILSAEVDGVLRVQTHTDLVKTIFNDPEVYWGFTSATGGSSNVQKMCTSLNPVISVPENLNTCAPASITFKDSSTSFGKIIKWWWDFGDGKTYDGQNPDPHYYPTPGNYTVKLSIEASNGCASDTLYNKIIIGSLPNSKFASSPVVICANAPAILIDSSVAEFGTINQWDWIFNQGPAEVQTSNPGFIKSFPQGPLQIDLIVKTKEGCISAPYSKTLDITQKPVTSMSVEDACFGSPVHFVAENQSAVPIRQWYWITGDGNTDSSANLNYYYARGGIYNVGLYAENEAGCSSDTISGIVTVFQTEANAGNDTVVAFGQPVQLNGSGGTLYQWYPPENLDDPTIANPIAILQDDKTYILKAYTTFGCPTYDTINIKAYRDPGIYVPNAFSPDGNGLNDYFHPVAPGIRIITHFEIYNRSGQRVFYSQTIGKGWDGNLNGKPQPVGTYVWIISGEDYLGKMHTEKGTVVLVR